jgi:transposase
MKKKIKRNYFKRKPIVLGDKYVCWRGVADKLKLNAQERLRVEWMIYYEKEAGGNATKTCHHFGISRKTFYKWYKRFNDSKQNVESLKNLSRRPHHVRQWEVTGIQESRIRRLRKKNMHYGKRKLKVLYGKEYGEEISCWKIERVIRKYRLYPDKEKQRKTARRQARARESPKKRIIQLKKRKVCGFYFGQTQ